MKLDIRRKVLLLVLSGSLLTFMLMTAFFAVNMIHARKAMDDQTEELANGKSWPTAPPNMRQKCWKPESKSAWKKSAV